MAHTAAAGGGTGVAAGAGQPPAPASRPRVASRAVVYYLILAGALLIPGIAAQWAGPIASLLGEGSTIAGALTKLSRALDDIRFGSGLRFWLGVTGAGLLALLLAYPLRKMIPGVRAIGSIGAWFHLHILIGLMAPVMILYHANFGPGGVNANVALATMLVVVASGLLGHIVYGRVSADFHGDRKSIAEQRAGLIAMLPATRTNARAREQLSDDLAALEHEVLTTGRGLAAGLRSRLGLGTHARQFRRDVAWIIQAYASETGATSGDVRPLIVAFERALQAHFAALKRAARLGVREQLLALWRYLHLPVFLIMVAASVLHVRAVWDLDAPPLSAKPERGEQQQVAAASAAPASAVAVAVASAPAAPIVAVAKPVAPTAAAPVAAPAFAPVAAPPAEDAPPADPERADMEAVYAALRAREAAYEKARSERLARQQDEARQPTSAAVAAAGSTAPATTAQTQVPAAITIADATVSSATPWPRTLAEQLALMKARRAAGTFAHALTETGFALTGKHTRLDCAACHKAPLTGVRSESPRVCLDCHKKDDVHRGRRPDCAQCHTTNNWDERAQR